MKARGFTLIELVIAITISAIVLTFVAMFITAPLGAYDTHSRRAVLVADTSGAWPRMEADLRAALPNSLRTRRNGNYVVIEMLKVLNVGRYTTLPSTLSFNTAGAYSGTPQYLSVNNRGTTGADAYALTGSMVAATINSTPTAIPGEYRIDVSSPPMFTAGDSPNRLIYFVEAPVTYLCDEGQGTLRRYANYTIAANQAARDTPGELGGPGVATEQVAQGLTSCNFQVSQVDNPTQQQTAAVRLTTTRNGDSVTLLHTSRAVYVP